MIKLLLFKHIDIVLNTYLIDLISVIVLERFFSSISHGELVY